MRSSCTREHGPARPCAPACGCPHAGSHVPSCRLTDVSACMFTRARRFARLTLNSMSRPPEPPPANLLRIPSQVINGILKLFKRTFPHFSKTNVVLRNLHWSFKLGFRFSTLLQIRSQRATNVSRTTGEYIGTQMRQRSNWEAWKGTWSNERLGSFIGEFIDSRDDIVQQVRSRLHSSAQLSSTQLSPAQRSSAQLSFALCCPAHLPFSLLASHSIASGCLGSRRRVCRSRAIGRSSRRKQAPSSSKSSKRNSWRSRRPSKPLMPRSWQSCKACALPVVHQVPPAVNCASATGGHV